MTISTLNNITMIIDLILARQENANAIEKDGKLSVTPFYNAKTFYNSVVGYGEIGNKIADALDNGENDDIQRALCLYVINNEYNANICKYVLSVDWL